MELFASCNKFSNLNNTIYIATQKSKQLEFIRNILIKLKFTLRKTKYN